jgi:hypothetical protein
MKILRIVYETEYCGYEAMFSNNPPVTYVISKYETEKRLFIAAIELAMFKATEDPCGPMVKRSLIQFDDNSEYEFPLGRFDKEVKLPFDRLQFRQYIVGDEPWDTISYAQGGTYAAQTNMYIKLLSGGRIVAIRWDSNGMAVEHSNGRMISVWAMSAGELATINAATRLAAIQLKRHSFLIFSGDSIGLLDPEHTARFYAALLDARQEDTQLVFLGRLTDVLDSPLTRAVPDMTIIDLDNKYALESEDK